jgi:predicted component of type VI protein secretion system
MHIHPRPEYEDPGHLDAHRPAPAGPETTMYERDQLFIRERVADLRATATQLRPDHDARGASIVHRTRRTIGRGLIAVGTAVAGATAELADRSTDVRATTDAPLAH